jgi:hypothetical protein
LVPDATLPTPPETGPAVAPAPTDTDIDIDTLYPGAWVSLEGTSTVAEGGTWLAVGVQGDVWVVSQIASNPVFSHFGWLVPSAEGLANGAAHALLPGGGAVVPGQAGPAPQGAPQLPPPVIPNTPQNTPDPFGGVGGGLIIPNPNARPPRPDQLPQELPIIGGIKWRVDPPKNPGDPRPPGFFVIPVPGSGGQDLQLRPDPDGGWSYRISGYMMPWLRLIPPPE